VKLRRLFIDTNNEHVVYILRDSPVCISEGFQSLRRITIECGDKKLVATLNFIGNDLLSEGDAGLSESAWESLEAKDGMEAKVSHPLPLESMKYVRAKMYGNILSQEQFDAIASDLVQQRFSNIEIAAFVSACSGDRLTIGEIGFLTQAMIRQGEKLTWTHKVITDKHCIGGLPGNRTTPIVVAVLAEAGLIIPKTSSRAITSPAGTADSMETITNVNLSPEKIRQIVDAHNGCFAWGGSVNLSPADDILIRLERALDMDSEGQMIASVLSKKCAAGSTHVLIDIPVGKTAKVRTQEKAKKLGNYFTTVGDALGLNIKVLLTDGSQPVGYGIGPALEALDVLAVLKCEAHAPPDLRHRSLLICGELLEFVGKTSVGEGYKTATEILDSGRAYTKFSEICIAQGGMREPRTAPYVHEVKTRSGGMLTEINNRKLAQLAKLAGAPEEPGAGLTLFHKTGAFLDPGIVLFTLYTRGQGELRYALDYYHSHPDIFTIVPK
jgi:thymidine phosphorylase